VLRIRAREGWYPVPDVCVYLPPDPEEGPGQAAHFLWIEILSDDDKITEIWKKAKSAIACGTPYVWIVDPDTLESELWTARARPGSRRNVAPSGFGYRYSAGGSTGE